MKHISSRDNPRFKELNALCGSVRERKKQAISVLEGVHLVQMAQTQPSIEMQTTAVSQASLGDPQIQLLLDRIANLNDVIVLPDTLFRSISQLVQGTSILQLIYTPQGDLNRMINTDVVYLESIQDPGNLGSILRTCVGAGVAHIVTSPDCVDAWSPKCLRAGMGAQFNLNVVEGLSFTQLREHVKTPVKATALVGKANLYQQALSEPSLWCFGNEGQGLSREVINATGTTLVQIPQAAGVESLNVGAAVAVCLFEQVRQRLSSQLTY